MCAAILFSSCAYIQKRIDVNGLKEIAKDIERDFEPGNPEKIEHLISGFSLEKYTEPVFLKKIKIESLDK